MARAWLVELIARIGSWFGIRSEATRRQKAWELAARQVGLAVVRSDVRGAARGVAEGYPIDIEWDRASLTVALRGPALADRDRARQLRAQLASALLSRSGQPDDTRLSGVLESDILARAALEALEALAQSGDAVFILTVTASRRRETPLLLACVRAAAWVADALGWKRDIKLTVATNDPDPRVRLRAWEQLLSGWAPTGYHSTVNHDLARTASRSSDPLVAVLGALHLGAEGLPLLRAAVLDPASTDEVVARALRGVWEELSAQELRSLLTFSRPGTEVVMWATRGLARVGTSADLPALRALADAPPPHGVAAQSAIDAIVSRVDASPGALSVVSERGSLSVAADRRGGLSRSEQ